MLKLFKTIRNYFRQRDEIIERYQFNPDKSDSDMIRQDFETVIGKF